MKKFIKKVLIKSSWGRKIVDRRAEKKEQKRLSGRVETIREKGTDVVKTIEDALTESGLIYFATCGTLLGLIRENRLLRNDYDLDYAVLIEKEEDWIRLENALIEAGFDKIRHFTLEGKVTEQTYRNTDGIEIDFFGHFIIDDEICFYSYDKLENVEYPSEDSWSAYILRNGKYVGVKKISTDVGVVTVPENAEEYLTYNYNDNWRIPDPHFKANTGKGCSLIKGKYGIIGETINK